MHDVCGLSKVCLRHIQLNAGEFDFFAEFFCIHMKYMLVINIPLEVYFSLSSGNMGRFRRIIVPLSNKDKCYGIVREN